MAGGCWLSFSVFVCAAHTELASRWPRTSATGFPSYMVNYATLRLFEKQSYPLYPVLVTLSFPLLFLLLPQKFSPYLLQPTLCPPPPPPPPSTSDIPSLILIISGVRFTSNGRYVCGYVESGQELMQVLETYRTISGTGFINAQVPIPPHHGNTVKHCPTLTECTRI